MTLSKRITIALVLAIASACGGAAPGTRPDEMSAAHHEAAAESHEAQAQQHSALYDETAREVHDRCAAAPGAGAPCWTWMTNPTEDHLREAEQHRRVAAEHRAASEALRTAEASSCRGVSDMDRDMCPLMNQGDIVGAAPLYTTIQLGRTTQQQLIGATLTMRAVPGLTAEWLQLVLECHVARAATLGHDEEMPNCPLSPAGVQVHVVSAGSGFQIELRGDATNAQEILRRAQAVAGAPTT